MFYFPRLMFLFFNLTLVLFAISCENNSDDCYTCDTGLSGLFDDAGSKDAEDSGGDDDDNDVEEDPGVNSTEENWVEITINDKTYPIEHPEIKVYEQRLHAYCEPMPSCDPYIRELFITFEFFSIGLPFFAENENKHDKTIDICCAVDKHNPYSSIIEKEFESPWDAYPGDGGKCSGYFLIIGSDLPLSDWTLNSGEIIFNGVDIEVDAETGFPWWPNTVAAKGSFKLNYSYTDISGDEPRDVTLNIKGSFNFDLENNR